MPRRRSRLLEYVDALRATSPLFFSQIDRNVWETNIEYYGDFRVCMRFKVHPEENTAILSAGYFLDEPERNQDSLSYTYHLDTPPNEQTGFGFIQVIPRLHEAYCTKLEQLRNAENTTQAAS